MKGVRGVETIVLMEWTSENEGTRSMVQENYLKAPSFGITILAVGQTDRVFNMTCVRCDVSTYNYYVVKIYVEVLVNYSIFVFFICLITCFFSFIFVI